MLETYEQISVYPSIDAKIFLKEEDRDLSPHAEKG
jgi:hypothetical protein